MVHHDPSPLFGLGSNVSGQDEGRSGDESVGSNEASGRDDRRLA